MFVGLGHEHLWGSCCWCWITSVISNSVLCHRQQPTRLPHPWDSPGKNTGVGCHFLLQCMKVKSESEVAQSCPTLRNSMDYSPPGSSVHGIFQARVLERGAIAFSIFGEGGGVVQPATVMVVYKTFSSQGLGRGSWGLIVLIHTMGLFILRKNRETVNPKEKL